MYVSVSLSCTLNCCILFLHFTFKSEDENGEKEKEEQEEEEDEDEQKALGQTYEEYLLEKTREFNIQTRERPHDADLWFRFVDFQDETAFHYKKASSAPVYI